MAVVESGVLPCLVPGLSRPLVPSSLGKMLKGVSWDLIPTRPTDRGGSSAALSLRARRGLLSLHRGHGQSLPMATVLLPCGGCLAAPVLSCVGQTL